MEDMKWNRVRKDEYRHVGIPPEITEAWVWCRQQVHVDGVEREDVRMWIFEEELEGENHPTGFTVHFPPDMCGPCEGSETPGMEMERCQYADTCILKGGSPPYKTLDGAQKVAAWIWAQEEIRDANSTLFEISGGLTDCINEIGDQCSNIIEAAMIAVDMANLFWEKWTSGEEPPADGQGE